MECTCEYWWISDFGVYGDGECGVSDVFVVVGSTLLHRHGPDEWDGVHVHCDRDK